MAEKKPDRKAEIAAQKAKRKLIKDTLKDQRSVTREMVKQVETADEFDSIVNSIFGTRTKAMQLEKEMQDALASGNEEEIKAMQTKVAGVKASESLKQSLMGQLAPMKAMVMGARNFLAAMMANPFLALVAGAIALVKLLMKMASAVNETRKEFGLSITAAAKLTAQNELLFLQAKAYGLETQEIKAAQTSIRENLGLSFQAAADLSLEFARTAAATGQSAEELGKSLSIMESMSGASREVLLNQIRSNAAMIEAAGVAPAQVMKDIASNTEFFAEFARDGGQNLIQAGVAAAKLGLSMDQVKSTTESLLSFEESIEKQMEASLLLGRQINLDRARQLALTGDQAGMMEEVLRQVGGEAEFAQMNYLQRKALADSVGSTVENLSRMVRNRSASATAGAVAESGDAGQEIQRNQLEILESQDKHLKHIADEV